MCSPLLWHASPWPPLSLSGCPALSPLLPSSEVWATLIIGFWLGMILIGQWNNLTCYWSYHWSSENLWLEHRCYHSSADSWCQQSCPTCSTWFRSPCVVHKPVHKLYGDRSPYWPGHVSDRAFQKSCTICPKGQSLENCSLAYRDLHAISSAIGRRKRKEPEAELLELCLAASLDLSKDPLILKKSPYWPLLRTFVHLPMSTTFRNILLPLPTLSSPANSPAHILLTRLRTLGLSVTSRGLAQDRFGTFDCYIGNFPEVCLRLQWAWQQLI